MIMDRLVETLKGIPLQEWLSKEDLSQSEHWDVQQMVAFGWIEEKVRGGFETVRSGRDIITSTNWTNTYYKVSAMGREVLDRWNAEEGNDK